MVLTTIISNSPSPKSSLPSRDHSTRAAFNRHNNKIKTSRKNHKHNSRKRDRATCLRGGMTQCILKKVAIRIRSRDRLEIKPQNRYWKSMRTSRLAKWMILCNSRTIYKSMTSRWASKFNARLASASSTQRRTKSTQRSVFKSLWKRESSSTPKSTE